MRFLRYSSQRQFLLTVPNPPGVPVVLATLIVTVAGPTNGGGPEIVFLTYAALTVAMGIALAVLGYLIQSNLTAEISAKPASA